jgi:glycosyltransferase involved in cell wall biosynthesis
MPKLLLVITKGNWGGAQRYVFDMATNLRGRYDVAVACGMPGTLVERLAAENVPVHVIPRLGRDISILGDLSSFFSLIKLFWKERPAVVHLNSSKIGGIGAVAARLCGIRHIIFTVHGFAFNEERPWWHKVLITIASWLSVLFATKAICINRTEYNQLIRWPMMKHKAVLIYNGLATPAFLKPAEARQHIATITNRPELASEAVHLVGTISELVANKGLTYAIEAFGQLPDSHFVIMGTGDQRSELENEARELGVADRVHFAGFVPGASQYLRGFDVFLLSSIKEGLPYVILEAGSAKIPVVSTNVGGIPDLITDMEHGILVQTRKPQELARAIAFMRNHKKQSQQFAKELCERVKSEFSIERMVQQTIAVYGVLPAASASSLTTPAPTADQ